MPPSHNLISPGTAAELSLPRVTADPLLIFQQDTLGWSRAFTQRYQSIMGLALLFQGKITKTSLKTFGLYGHTSFCHGFQIIRGKCFTSRYICIHSWRLIDPVWWLLGSFSRVCSLCVSK